MQASQQSCSSADRCLVALISKSVLIQLHRLAWRTIGKTGKQTTSSLQCQRQQLQQQTQMESLTQQVRSAPVSGN